MVLPMSCFRSTTAQGNHRGHVQSQDGKLPAQDVVVQASHKSQLQQGAAKSSMNTWEGTAEAAANAVDKPEVVETNGADCQCFRIGNSSPWRTVN